MCEGSAAAAKRCCSVEDKPGGEGNSKRRRHLTLPSGRVGCRKRSHTREAIFLGIGSRRNSKILCVRRQTFIVTRFFFFFFSPSGL